MKIIDARFRPPYKTLKNAFLFTGYDAPGQIVFRQQMGLTESVAARTQSMSAMLQEMDTFKVVKGVVCTRVTDGGDNDELTELLEAYPERFIGFPHIEPYDSKCAVSEIERLVVNGKCTGIYLEPGFRMEKIVMHADDERMNPIYDICSQEDIPIILQYGGGKNTVEYYTPTDIDHIMANFPKLKIMISHGGWPQVMNFIHQAYKHPEVYISPDCYFYGYPGSQDYITAANGILQDKMIFGSAFPLYSLRDTIKMYLDNIKPEIQEKVMYENGARFFKLDDAAQVTLADNHTK